MFVIWLRADEKPPPEGKGGQVNSVYAKATKNQMAGLTLHLATLKCYAMQL